MVVRRPLVLSGQFISEADDNDGKVLLGTLTLGSGLGDETTDYANNYTVNSYIAAQSSGVIFVNEGGVYKLADDGSSQVAAELALSSGNVALLGVEPAYASGIEAQRISTEALASGNSAFLANLSGVQQSSAAVVVSSTAVASGDAAGATAQSYLPTILNATTSGTYALGSGAAANEDSAEAYASGVAALELLASNPFLSEDDLIGLIMALG